MVNIIKAGREIDRRQASKAKTKQKSIWTMYKSFQWFNICVHGRLRLQKEEARNTINIILNIHVIHVVVVAVPSQSFTVLYATCPNNDLWLALNCFCFCKSKCLDLQE